MSKTLDLLFDVELPISISFGHTRVALRDIFTLKPDVIIELNCSCNSPVDLIVNNSVIARGELVVVDNSYGVRIQEVTTLKERLHTLN